MCAGADSHAFEKYRKESVKAKTVWTDTEFISEQGTYFLGQLGLANDFEFPKPPELIRRCIQLATDKNDLVMDSFGGSGTTGQAVLTQNREDGGARRFIIVEMNEKIAQTVTRERLRRVSEGYQSSNGEYVEGIGGGFQYCRLSEKPLFDASGQIDSTVSFKQLAEFSWFMETGLGLSDSAIDDRMKTPYLGSHKGRSIFLLYNGILSDKSELGGNVLNIRTLAYLNEIAPHKDEEKVIYGARTRFDKLRLAQLGVTFHQLPYELAVKTWL